MAKYRGNGLIVQFVNALGTAQFQTPQTSFDVARDCDLIDVSSGNDTDREYILGLKKGTATLKYFDDTAQAANSGTALAAQVTEGTFGTLYWGPQGTAVGMPKGGFAAWVKTHKFVEPFDKAVDIEVMFEKHLGFISDYGAHW
jgi:hypothetical protein